jgi:hypothetical protein
VTIPDDKLGSDDAEKELRGRICEIQLHTRAQNLWATVDHELIYKAPLDIPSTLKRNIYRLMALLELFDKEVEAGREAIMRQPNYEEAHVLADLERHFFALTAREYDAELSIYVIRALLPLLNEAAQQAFGPTIDAFVAEHSAKLQAIYDDYLEDDRNPFMSQPESILIFERLAHDSDRLAERWTEVLPNALLRSLSEIWGTPIDV